MTPLPHARVLSFLACCGSLCGQGQPGLLADLSPALDTSGSSLPEHAVVAGGRFFFPATEPTAGMELWSSNGTAAGTVLARDIRPGPEGSSPALLGALNGVVLFVADDGVHGFELWRSDGTAAGTFLVKDIQPGPLGGATEFGVRVGGVLLFAAFDGVSGRELWRTDGTSAGTWQVADLFPGAGWGLPDLQLSSAAILPGDVLLFVANDGTTGAELWRTDGTAAGTRRCADIQPGSASSNPQGMTVAAGVGYFSALTPGIGIELWRSDGTTPGTALVLDLSPGSGPGDSGNPRDLVTDGTRLYFWAYHPSYGLEPWVSDGTPAGTAILKDVAVGPNGSYYGNQHRYPRGEGRQMLAVGTTLFFAANDGSGLELWRSDGTTPGTVPLRDIWPGAMDSLPSYLTEVSGLLYFSAVEPNLGRELWSSDGTTVGTQLVWDVCPGPSWSYALPLVASGPALLFCATDGSHGFEPWMTFAFGPTQLVLDIHQSPRGSAPRSFVGAPGAARALFVADDGVLGAELWRSDGTRAGTALVADLAPGSLASAPGEFGYALGRFFFAAADGTHGVEPHVTDGTTAGTTLLADLNPVANAGSLPAGFTPLRGVVVFTADDGVHGRELWASDGTALGTVLVLDIRPGSAGSNPTGLLRWNDRVLFAADDGVAGIELWQTDGTAGGTRLLVDLEPGLASSLPRDLLAVGDAVCFVARTTATGEELWRTDGTAAGTGMVKDIYPGSGSSQIRGLMAQNGVLFFAADDLLHGLELWRSDGTAGGTLLVADVRPGLPGSGLAGLVACGGALLFRADDGMHGAEPWRSDGTAAGTALVADVFPGPGSSFPNSFFAEWILAPPGCSRALLRLDDGVHGVEPWITDGTAAGTRLLQDVRPGPLGSAPGLPARIGTSIYFAANDGVYGLEPWAMASMAVAVPFGIGCAGTGGRSPALAGTGTPTLGNSAFAAELRSALPGAPCLLALDRSAAQTRLSRDCWLWVSQPILLLAVASSNQGTASVTLPIPADPSLVGGRLFAQAVVVDPGAPGGLLAFSNGLEILVARN